MRDREVVECLLGMEQWLRELNRPLASAGVGGSVDVGASSSLLSGFPPCMEGDALRSAYRSALSELRLLVLGVLNTMPWWRVVETVAGNPPAAQTGGARTASAGGGDNSSSEAGAARVAARHAGGWDRSAAALHVITRWHARLQIAFERVCLVLIDQSQQTVRGVLEVLLKPCQLRPPVRDGARRSIPSDSFIRVLNAVATKYSPVYVVELLEGCIADFMPRRRWAERRHHVACTAVLLYLALEGHTPAYHPQLGNSQSLQRAVGLLKSLRSRRADGRGALSGSPWLLPPATGSYSLTLPGGTSEESGTDLGGLFSPMSAKQEFHHASLSSMLPTTGVLPSGYVSATLLERARAGEVSLRQPTLPHPSLLGGSSSLMDTTTTASDTELSDGGARVGGRARSAVSDSLTGGPSGRCVRAAFSGGGGGSDSSAATAVAARGKGRSGGGLAGQLSSEGGGSAGIVPGTAVSAGAPSDLDVTVQHNNKLLSYRNDILRVLLNRLLDVELTLEPRDAEEQQGGWSLLGGMYGLGGGGPSSALSLTSRHASVRCSPFGSPATPGLGSPSALLSAPASLLPGGSGGGTASAFPSTPIAAADTDTSRPTATASSDRSSPASFSPTAFLLPRSDSLGIIGGTGFADWSSAAASPGASLTSAQPLERFFNTLSHPYLRILRDCATLVYGRLADDLRRQQIAGSCGNADWWMDIVPFYLTVVTRVDRPVCLLYLAPSLSMLGTEDEPVGLLHKLITLVTKGSMPVEQPRSSSSVSGAFARSSAMWPSSATASVFSASSLPLSAAPAQPVRLRMALPTGVSRRVVTMEERLRAVRHIFPLFRFLHSRIDEASGEGVRRRLLKWTAQELRRLGGPSASAVGSSGGPGGNVYTRSRPLPSRETRLALVTFAQCAAISELMGVDVVPQLSSAGKAARDSSRFTSSTAYGDTSDGIAAALEPFLNRYTLQSEPPAEDGDNENSNCSAASSSASLSESSSSPFVLATSATRDAEQARLKASGKVVATAAAGAPPVTPCDTEQRRRRRRIDLRQMEFEGLLQPQLMAYCPWQAWLR
ncbi:conserved hypothetical protein [Leishmania major strain Friedlin]|uniref:Uncharacterized protein n=1 Tax=Leishmania major TaxID=5664 RepID=Q4Q3S7_LEIMA|nr:conserved hypothetical protein [Leishmania major strain Friedlin]CAG9580906.1 hypothetical_protein_-_conserved [Leishmania major strain Friedlin]CAJ06718.1 conserved hypothetical protein [Leishmania major strain Friedlin]|eukprot:XP_001686021.1 conserved hypothetical protein [Leishmania major strain Friedlin]